MNEPHYTLEELAKAFGLTLRTARHYIENVLPAHHKKGRGRLARYGQDTWNSFAFMRKAREEGLTTTQISGVLADLSQSQIDRVADGLEELTIVPTPSIESRGVFSSHRMASASHRMKNVAENKQPFQEEASLLRSPQAEFKAEIRDDVFDKDFIGDPESAPRWQVLYSDDELQITHQGDASADQREQVRLAARLIKRILRN
jgi:DNA-binding transcriptional MerR regulator